LRNKLTVGVQAAKDKVIQPVQPADEWSKGLLAPARPASRRFL